MVLPLATFMVVETFVCSDKCMLLFLQPGTDCLCELSECQTDVEAYTQFGFAKCFGRWMPIPASLIVKGR